MWVYHADTRRAILFGDYGLSNSIGFNIELSTGHGLRFYWNGSPDYSSGLNVGLNTWNHVALTYDGASLKSYLNGNLVATRSGALATRSKTAGEFRLGRDNRTTDTALNGKLNDIRVYGDHCLSAAEVKEIAQGLVLHYKLDASSEEKITTVLSTNVYSYPTFNTSTASGGWNHWGPSGHSGSYGQNTDKKYIYNKNNTYSHWITEDAGTGKYYLLYQSPAFEGGYRSLQAIIKEENGLPITESICYPDWNARNGGVPNYKWTTIKSLGDGFYYCCCEGISQDGSNDLIGIIVQPGYKIYVSECYLENNTETCSPIFTYSSNIVQDSSGYNNYATINSAIQLSSDTPRYTSASYFGVYNTPNAILSNASILPALNNCTITWWGKYDTTKTLLLTGQSTSHYIGASTNNNNYYHGNAGSPVMYKDGVSGTYKCAADGWHFFALTGVNISTWTTLKINGYGSGWPLNGYISDFRIYCTPLLDTDIKQLYNVSMKVDNQYNVHTFEIIERNVNKINKNGQVQFSTIYENGLIEKLHYDKTIYTEPDGSTWVRVFHHNDPTTSGLFIRDSDWEHGVYESANKWYDIEQIIPLLIKYEFMVKQKTTSSANEVKYRWVQTANPLTCVYGDVSPGHVTINTSTGYANSSQGGLWKMNSNARMCIANSSSGNWYGAMGSWSVYNTNNVPGYPNSNISTGYLDFYVRIYPNVKDIKNYGLTANQFIER